MEVQSFIENTSMCDSVVYGPRGTTIQPPINVKRYQRNCCEYQ